MGRTGLDRQQLACCVKLLEDGTNPDALAVGLSDILSLACRRGKRKGKLMERVMVLLQAVIRDLRVEAKKAERVG